MIGDRGGLLISNMEVSYMGKPEEIEETMNIGMRLPVIIVKELDQIISRNGGTRSALARELVISALRARKDPKGEDWQMKCHKLEAQIELLKEMVRGSKVK